MPININSGLQVLDNTPVDARYVVTELTDLVGFASNNIYEGLTVYVTATNETYVLTNVAQYNSINNGWTLLGANFSTSPAGPIGSLQYRLNAGYTSGSENLLFISASNTLLLTGSLNHGGGNETYGNSHAEGALTRALGSYSHAEGFLTYASGAVSHAEGFRTYANGDYSHTEGAYTSASAIYSHTEGYYTLTTGEASHAEGYYTTASGDYSHAEGYETQALGARSHAEGRGTIAQSIGAHAEGANTYAGFITGISSIESSANYAHAEGSSTRAAGFASHAEGAVTLASGDYAHAQGVYVTASGFGSFAGGDATIAAGYFTTAIGIANQTTDGLLVIGNGTEVGGAATERKDLAVFKADQIILSQSIYLPDLDLVSVTTGKKFVIINPNTGFLEYSATGPAGSGGGGDITAVYAGNGLSGGGNDGDVTLTLDTGSLHFGLGVSASAAFYGFGGGGGTSNLDITNNTNNNIVTATGTNTLNGESNLTFNGSTLAVTGNVTATSLTGSLLGTGSWAINALTASYLPAGIYQITASWASNSITSSYILNAVSASYVLNAVSASYTTTASYAYASATASYVNGLNQRVHITGSLIISASTSAHIPALTIIGSGSSNAPVVEFRGNTGGLMSVYDRQSGSLFSVNDISGLSMFDVRSNSDIYLGNPAATSLYTTNKVNATVGNTTIYTIPTASYDGAFIEYTAKNGINIKVGSVLATWNNSTIAQQEIATTSIGTTTDVNIGFILNDSNALVTGSVASGTWTIKTIIRSI